VNLEGEVDWMGSLADPYVLEGLGGNQLDTPSGLDITPASATGVLPW